MSFEPKKFQQIYEEMRNSSSVVTDFQVGSVTRTLYESFAYELGLLYEKMNHVYLAGYVDTATASQLDQVVAILGIKRGLPDFAEGKITFIRNAGNESIVIPINTLVATEESGDQEKKVYQTLQEGILEAADTEIDIKIRAVGRGEAETTPAETIIVMPKPLPGIKSVINKEDIRFTGKVRESDEQLRERAKNTLISAGKASIVALENALLSLPKVKGVKIHEDFSTPDGYGVIDIFVDGPDLTDTEDRFLVETTIEAVRAAGIFTRLQGPSKIQLDGVFTIELNNALNLSDDDKLNYTNNVKTVIQGYLDQLRIGESLIFAKLIKEVLSVDGVDNLDDIAITTTAPDERTEDYIFENKRIDIGEFDRLNAREITVTTV